MLIHKRTKFKHTSLGEARRWHVCSLCEREDIRICVSCCCVISPFTVVASGGCYLLVAAL